MGDADDDIFHLFQLSQDNSNIYDVVKAKFKSHFVQKQSDLWEGATLKTREMNVVQLTVIYISLSPSPPSQLTRIQWQAHHSPLLPLTISQWAEAPLLPPPPLPVYHNTLALLTFLVTGAWRSICATSWADCCSPSLWVRRIQSVLHRQYLLLHCQPTCMHNRLWGRGTGTGRQWQWKTWGLTLGSWYSWA